MTEVHLCHLLRSTEQDEWFKFQEATYLTISTNGVTLRASSTNTLILDLPASVIGTSHLLSDRLVRIWTKGGITLALQFDHSHSLTQLVLYLESSGVSVNRAGQSGSCPHDKFHDKERGGFPNVSDAAVQEVLLRLLFSSHFDDFVQELGSWLDHTRERLP